MRSDSLTIAVNLRRSLSRLNRRLRQNAREGGISISPVKHAILGHLYRDGPKTPGALAAAEGVQPQSITRVLAELVESGLASRNQDDIDRRQFKVAITPEGRELVKREARSRALWLASALESSLTEIEQDMLRVATQILDRLADAADVSKNSSHL